MQEFLTNVVLLIYLGIVLLYKLVGYTYFAAAWRAGIWITVLVFLGLSVRYGYLWVLHTAEQNEPLETPQAEPNENS